MKATFTLIFLLFLITTVSSQKNSTVKTATAEKTYYVLCDCAISNTVDYIPTYVQFAPFPIKENKSTNIPFFSEAASIKISGENISSIAHIFDEEFGFTNIKAGDKISENSHGCRKYATIDSAMQRHNEDVNRILNLYKGWRSDRFGLYLVTWQPPTKYTGIAPTDSVPIIQNGKTRGIVSAGKSSAGSITVEKKDTSFQEAEDKRKLEAKKAEVQREIRLQAIKNKAEAEDKERIRLLLEAQKKRGNKQ